MTSEELLRERVEVQRDELDAASRRPRDRDELARRMRDGSFRRGRVPADTGVQPGVPREGGAELDGLPPGSAVVEMLND